MLSLSQQWPLIFASIIALLLVEQVGIIIGWSSPVLGRFNSENATMSITNDEGSWLATMVPLMSIITTPLAAIGLHYLGRKLTMLITIFPFLISWCIISFAKTPLHLIIARGVAGVGVGFGYTTVPVYLGEISPDNIRGGIGVCMAVVANIGTLWIYGIGAYTELWISSLTSSIPLLLFIICYKWLPESPYYLLQKDRSEDAKQSLKKLTNSENVDEELKKIELTLSSSTDTNILKELFTEASHRRALFICLGTFTFAQFTGGVTFLFYAHLIFQKAGDVSANTMSMIVALLQLITSIGAAYIVDNVGKKPLLIISSIGSAIFMACEGVYFYLLDNNYNVEKIWWLPLVAMILFNMSQAIGLSPISLAYLGELFHPKVKSVAVCIGKAYLSLTVFVVGKLYQVMSDHLGNSIPFFIFSIVGIFSALFFIFCVPETKGKSLDDIQYYMKHKTYKKNTNL